MLRYQIYKGRGQVFGLFVAQSLFQSLKLEVIYKDDLIKTIAQAKTAIFEYIVISFLESSVLRGKDREHYEITLANNLLAEDQCKGRETVNKHSQ